MFERFNQSARQALVSAQAQARDDGAAAIEADHLLFALAGGPPDDPATQALAGIELAPRLPGGRPSATRTGPDGGGLELAPTVRAALEMALREALSLRDSYIGAEHLLLALLDTAPNLAVQRVVSADVDPLELRRRIAVARGIDPGAFPDAPRGVRRAVERAQRPRRRWGGGSVPRTE